MTECLLLGIIKQICLKRKRLIKRSLSFFWKDIISFCSDNHFIGVISDGYKKTAGEPNRDFGIDDIELESYFVDLVGLFEALHFNK